MALGTPELLIILILGLVVLGGLLVVVTLTLVSVKRAADRSTAADQDRQGSRDANR
jgi:Flp pilus assembly protein protease CpaA